MKSVSNLQTLVGFSESLADNVEKDPDSVTCSHVGPGLARSCKTGPQAPVKKSERIPVRDKLFSKSPCL